MRFLRVRDVCRMVGFSKTTLYTRLKNGTFPTPITLGPQTVVFVESDIIDWMKNQVERGETAKTPEIKRPRRAN